MAIELNQNAPLFTLKDTEKNDVSLANYSGQNVVLLFFPLAFTGVCTTELCGIRDDLTTYNDLNTQVLAVSVDSLFSLGKFKEEHNLNFPVLSDFNKEVSALYDAQYEEFVLLLIMQLEQGPLLRMRETFQILRPLKIPLLDYSKTQIYFQYLIQEKYFTNSLIIQ